jgi:molybdate transport system substrate-binding protein
MLHRRSLLAATLLLTPAVLSLAAPASAAEIKVLSANALNIPERELAAAFTKATGNQVVFTFGSPGQVDQRVTAGEAFDLVILADSSAAAFEQQGKWRTGTRRPFARVGIGLAVREGTKLDLSTVESTRKALLDAKSVTFSDSSTGGLSGINAQKVLANLGIAGTVKGKASSGMAGQEMIGRGEVEIGLYNVSEIPRAKGVALAGPVPSAVQVYINYDAAVPAASAAPDAALALLKYFSQDPSRPRWAAAGLELTPE